jgi:hypothetical protein
MVPPEACHFSRHFSRRADGPGETERLVGDQYEERLEAHLSLRQVSALNFEIDSGGQLPARAVPKAYFSQHSSTELPST